MQPVFEHYGYFAVLIGTFLEGEMTLVLGALAAQAGYLDLSAVIASAMAGTMAGDQLGFFLGRRGGRALLDKRPGWAARADALLRLLQRHQLWVMLGYRFLYGVRSVATLAIGTSYVATRTFIILSTAATALWVATFVLLGQLFGYGAERLVDDVQSYQQQGVTLLALVIASVVTLRWYRRRRAAIRR